MVTLEILKVYFPYVIKRTEKGRWIVLNRNYKPLGYLSREWVDYDDPKHSFLRIGNGNGTLTVLGRIWKDGVNSDAEGKVYSVYLYNDKTNPSRSAENMAVYLEKLSRLSTYQIVL